MTDEQRNLIDPAEIGRKGGLSRGRNVTKKERSESASNAAKARWAGHVPKAGKTAGTGKAKKKKAKQRTRYRDRFLK